MRVKGTRTRKDQMRNEPHLLPWWEVNPRLDRTDTNKIFEGFISISYGERHIDSKEKEKKEEKKRSGII